MPKEPSLLSVAKEISKREAKNTLPADRDYVVPTTAEIHREYEELVAIGEIVVPRHFDWPDRKAPKKKLMAAVAIVDPDSKIAERATLRRLLKAKKVSVHDDCPTADMVQMAMKSGALGRENKARSV